MKVLRKLPEMVEQRIVAGSIFEFECEDDQSPPALVRLRVTIDPSCLTVHDVWDAKAKDVKVSWFQLHQLARLIHDWEGSVSDAHVNLETSLEALRELRCALGGVRGVPTECARPPCGGEPVVLGPATGVGRRCAASPLEWGMAAPDYVLPPHPLTRWYP